MGSTTLDVLDGSHRWLPLDAAVGWLLNRIYRRGPPGYLDLSYWNCLPTRINVPRHRAAIEWEEPQNHLTPLLSYSVDWNSHGIHSDLRGRDTDIHRSARGVATSLGPVFNCCHVPIPTVKLGEHKEITKLSKITFLKINQMGIPTQPCLIPN